MSVFGDNKRYIEGARRQAELSKEFYPDWQVRIYVDNADNFSDFDDEIIINQVNDGTDGVFWRFLPMFENENNIVLVRDSDGRITSRESMAVEEWLRSDKSFHTFRDHEAHYEFPIIACAFGYKGRLPEVIKNTMNDFNTKFYYTSDQVWLRDCVWPYVKNDSMVHSMIDTDTWFAQSRNKLKNKYSFCGNGFDENDMPLYAENLRENASFDLDKLDRKYKFDKGELFE